jgi:hypothetical protein
VGDVVVSPIEANLEQFCLAVLDRTGLNLDTSKADELLSQVVKLDEVAWAGLLLAIEEINPFFDLPEQLGIDDVTLADLHYFCCIMTTGHQERAGR